MDNVTDPGGLSRILIFPPSWIPNLGSRIQQQQQKERGKKIVVLPSFVASNIRKLKLILFLKKKKIEPNYKNLNFHPKNCN
jgi:hypothetical protein